MDDFIYPYKYCHIKSCPIYVLLREHESMNPQERLNYIDHKHKILYHIL